MTHTTSEGTVRYGYLPSLPGMPKLIVVARVIVIGLSTMWALIICELWVAGRSESQSALGPILTSFALGMDSGGWAGYLLIPLAGCVLTVSNGSRPDARVRSASHNQLGGPASSEGRAERAVGEGIDSPTTGVRLPRLDLPRR